MGKNTLNTSEKVIDKKKLLKSQIFHLSEHLHKALNEKHENKPITSENSEGGGIKEVLQEKSDFFSKRAIVGDITRFSAKV